MYTLLWLIHNNLLISYNLKNTMTSRRVGSPFVLRCQYVWRISNNTFLLTFNHLPLVLLTGVRFDLGGMGGRRRGAGGVPRSASLSDEPGSGPGGTGRDSTRKGGRKMSLSCLANSILSLEKGRRRAVSKHVRDVIMEQTFFILLYFKL